MALRSLLAKTTTATLSRARAPSVPVSAVAPRMSPASSSRRYTSHSQGDHDSLELKKLNVVITRLLTQIREDAIRETRSEKTWSLGPTVVALGFGACTACIGHVVGFISGYHFGVETRAFVLDKKKSDESTDDA